MRFELPSINPDKLKSAKLSVYALKTYTKPSQAAGKNGEKKMYQILTKWDAASVKWNSPWKKAGAATASGDLDSNSALTNNTTSITVWEDYNVTDIVKTQLRDPSKNFGYMFAFKNFEPARGIYYCMSEYKADEKLRPKLELVYDQPTSTNPEQIGLTVNALKVINTNQNVSVTLGQTQNFKVELYSLSGKALAAYSTTTGKIGFNLSSQNMQIMKVTSVHGVLTTKISPK